VHPRWLYLYLAAGLIALTLSACGGEGDKLSNAKAREMEAALDGVERGVESGDCGQASARAATFSASVERLEGDVDPNLHDALSAGARRLKRLVARNCQPSPPPAPPAVAAPPAVSPEELEAQQEETKKEAEKRLKEAKKEAEKRSEGGKEGGGEAQEGSREAREG
jgi:hypothetical protein